MPASCLSQMSSFSKTCKYSVRNYTSKKNKKVEKDSSDIDAVLIFFHKFDW
jgi:hypothetical protein